MIIVLASFEAWAASRRNNIKFRLDLIRQAHGLLVQSDVESPAGTKFCLIGNTSHDERSRAITEFAVRMGFERSGYYGSWILTRQIGRTYPFHNDFEVKRPTASAPELHSWVPPKMIPAFDLCYFNEGWIVLSSASAPTVMALQKKVELPTGLSRTPSYWYTEQWDHIVLRDEGPHYDSTKYKRTPPQVSDESCKSYLDLIKITPERHLSLKR